MRAWRLGLLAVLGMGLAGCSVDDPAEPDAAMPARVVSLAPSLTEIALAVGAGERLVGRTDYCLFPPEARGIDSVGRMDRPDIEGLLALDPDLIAATSLTPPDVLERLAGFGVAVVTYDHAGLDGLIADIRAFGERLGRTTATEALARRFENAVARARERAAAAGPERPRVLLLYDLDGRFSAGPGSFAGDLIEAAGGDNLAADAPSSWPRLEMEAILARDPEVLLLTWDGTVEAERRLNERIAGLKEDPLWRGVTAVRSGRVHLIHDDLLSIPGPRTIDALERISAALYSDR